MATTPVTNLMQDIANYQYNPALIQRAVLAKLSEATNGVLEIVDPTNPFVFCLEASAVLTSAFMTKNEASTRKQYPYSAQTSEDLYVHMSDKDYVDRFAKPSTTKFSLLLPYDETLTKLVTDPLTGIRKLVIPRNTFFTVAGINFSLQYPIEVRQLAHGGIQVIYNTDSVSPLQTLTTNIIEYSLRQTPDNTWIYFEFDVQQFSILSQTGTLNSAVDFSATITLDDQYYYSRVYLEDNNGLWVEIYTTHTDQIYDINTPTAVIKVVDNIVTVSIPQIYTNTLLINKGIRIDTYQTKGKLDLILWEYPFSAFTATWQTYDKADDTPYTAPLKSFKTLIPFSDKAVSGGSDPITFDDLRLRVIMNAVGAPSLPITNVQIESTLSRLGYEVVKNVDIITNRIFLATKGMPEPVNTSLITAAGASIATVAITLTNVVMLDTVIDNGTSITITPDTIYTNINGITSIVPSSTITYLQSLPVDKRALVVTNGSYLYTPFHYILDMNSNEFDLRPYYLDNPTIDTKLFVSQNDTALIQVNTQAYGIARTLTGYAIQIVTKSGDTYKALKDDEVFVQLAFVPYGEKDLAYLAGTLIGKDANGERIYSFDLSTNFNIDINDNIQLSKFFLYSNEPRLTGSGLLNDFDIVYSTSTLLGSQWIADATDLVVGKFFLPSRIAGITHEKLRVRFGYALKTLWSRARSVISSIPYKTYPANVPRLYETDIYIRDTNGSAIIFDANGNPTINYLHHKGDPVLDKDGNQIYQYYQGDVMLDAFGNPITTDTRGMIRQIDVMLIEGVYWFATDVSAVNYRTAMTRTLVDNLVNDLASITNQLLEQTRVYFYPKTTLGAINVMVADGILKSITAGQAFVVTLYVNGIVYANTALRDKLAKATIGIIANALTSTTVSVDLMTTTLRAQYGNDVISVQLNGLGGDLALPALTVIDGANRCSIRKRLVALANGSLIVEEDVTVAFVKNELVI